jgi:hypothetical protein
MTHDQLARVFPDGRTVHVPTDGKPLAGYQLAMADIEKRDGDDRAMTKSSPSLWTSLFKGKSSNDDEEEAVSAPDVSTKTPAIPVAAAKSADATPMPRSKPSTFQLASADAQITQPAKSKQAAAVPADKTEPKPQTPADIINARGFWGDAAAPKQATPAQVAAISARQALASAGDPQSTASVSAAFKALAYAPASSSPVDRANIVAASAPIPRSLRPASAPRNPMALNNITTVASKGPQGQAGVVATSTRIAAFKGTDIWMRAMILAPSASTAMSATVLGDTDMTTMRTHFAKPEAAVTMSFSDDPQLGLVSDRFTGSATATLATQSFITASLR